MMDASSLGLSAVFLLGLSFGAGPCTLSCLPFLGPVFMAADKQGWQAIVPFSLGRLIGYTSLGAVAAYLGFLVEDWLASHWPGIILGYAALLLALTMLFKPKSRHACSKKKSPQAKQTISFKPHQTAYQGSLFFLGFGMTLNPCAPLTIVITAAAATGSPELGALLGLSFGLGAVILPAFIFTYGMTHFSHVIHQALSQWKTPLEIGSITLLILMGSATAFGWITL